MNYVRIKDVEEIFMIYVHKQRHKHVKARLQSEEVVFGFLFRQNISYVLNIQTEKLLVVVGTEDKDVYWLQSLGFCDSLSQSSDMSKVGAHTF